LHHEQGGEVGPVVVAKLLVRGRVGVGVGVRVGVGVEVGFGFGVRVRVSHGRQSSWR